MISSIATLHNNLRQLRRRTGAVVPSAPAEIRDMMEVATLIYHFSDLRKKHRQGRIKLEDDRIIAETIREPIEAGDLHKLFSENEVSFREGLGVAVPHPQLVVSDDLNDEKELVYGINVNHSLERVVVVFRGSVTLNDFITDAKIRQMHITNPVKGDNLQSKIGLHTGFKEYKFGEDLFGEDGKSSTKCNKIIDEVKGLLQKHRDYRLYVTGHSLGVALSTLFAFHVVAASSEMGIRGPVTCIPIASPKVGDFSFQTAFQSLEESGAIRLIRFQNNLDLVTLVPNPYTFRFSAVFSPSRMYRHVGMSVTLYKKLPCSLDGSSVYRKMETVRNVFTHIFMLWRTVPTLIFKSTTFFENHSCDEYLERLLALNTQRHETGLGL